MEQRSLRLGDLVDDYCPRERRVTNHVIVVLDGDAIRHTRCNTCDAEHEFKEAKAPRRKGKGDGSDLSGGTLVLPKAAAPNGAATEPAPVTLTAGEPIQPAPAQAPAAASEPVAESKADDTAPAEGWLAHRPLIRASLPRVEGEAPPQPRAIPEFTMHQRHGPGPGRGFGGRGGGGFRHAHGHPGHNGSGRMPPPQRDGNGEPDGNRPPGPGGGGGGGGKSRHRRRRRR